MRKAHCRSSPSGHYHGVLAGGMAHRSAPHDKPDPSSPRPVPRRLATTPRAVHPSHVPSKCNGPGRNCAPHSPKQGIRIRARSNRAPPNGTRRGRCVPTRAVARQTSVHCPSAIETLRKRWRGRVRLHDPGCIGTTVSPPGSAETNCAAQRAERDNHKCTDPGGDPPCLCVARPWRSPAEAHLR